MTGTLHSALCRYAAAISLPETICDEDAGLPEWLLSPDRLASAVWHEPTSIFPQGHWSLGDQPDGQTNLRIGWAGPIVILYVDDYGGGFGGWIDPQLTIHEWSD